ncbi:similar to An07g02510 [Aspergillus luchuensis IFO 4308]|nr:similar to An07g02510 [Aspergillus luchuensis IFO 4308]
MTVEYKPPHKLPVEEIRLGLRPLEFWKEIVKTKTTPTDGEEKRKYDAAVLTGSAVVQEYRVMIMKGLQYSYVSTGLALIMLRVPYHEPGTLYYHLFEPNSEISLQDGKRPTNPPLTSVARVLCLCLMSCSVEVRDKAWREKAKKDLPTWTTGFDTTSSEIPQFEPNQSPTASQHSHSTTIKSDSTSCSSYQPSHSSVGSSPTENHRMPTRASSRRHRTPDADTNTGPRRQKRRISENAEPSGLQEDTDCRGDDTNKDTAQFCTQRCLLGLQHGRSLDEQCPNVALHRLGANGDHHQILPETLVRKIEKQLNKEFDHGCTPIGGCASTGPLFKITSSTLGYTVVGKGASANLWKEKVSHEADIYRILHQAQGSAVPVVLGTVDLRMTYFSHEADINHMLLMAWAGKQIDNCEDKSFKREVKRSEKEIRSLGVIHHKIQRQNALWNPELRRVLIIDFDYSQLDSLPNEKRQFLMGKKIRDPYGRKRPSSVPLE